MTDLAAYFDRIGYGGPATATLDTVRALQALHVAAIPFENVDVLLGRGVSLAPEAIDAKLIAARRGGYCFEQNDLFHRVLAAIGFETGGLMGRVVWMSPPDAPRSPRTHRVVTVALEGQTWLIDVGLGGAVPTAPIRWTMDTAQETPHEPYRLRDGGEEVVLEARLEDWTPIYRLSRETPAPIDYEVGNWFTSAHRDSKFRRNLMVARTTADARRSLLNNRLTIRPPNGPAERHVLDADGVEAALSDIFGLAVEPSWRAMIERAVAAGT